MSEPSGYRVSGGDIVVVIVVAFMLFALAVKCIEAANGTGSFRTPEERFVDKANATPTPEWLCLDDDGTPIVSSDCPAP